LTARLLKVLQENPDVYAKTAFIINYDEGGQFFDHHWTPTPPATPEDGESTADVSGDLTQIATEGVATNSPIGMGFRVPLFVVSPWSRTSGGAVYGARFPTDICTRGCHRFTRLLACSLEANLRATHGIQLRCPLFLPLPS